MVTSRKPGNLREVMPPDQVARWEELRATYPQACYTTSDGWFFGALRDEDNVMRRSDLGRLIDALLARETYPDGPGLSPAGSAGAIPTASAADGQQASSCRGA
jgi:hypothetical protein